MKPGNGCSKSKCKRLRFRNKNKKATLAILKKLFWDYDLNSVKQNIHSPFVIARVLELGNIEQFYTLSKTLGDEAIIEFLKTRGERMLSKKSLNFWKIYYAKKIR